ncbi:MAG TPA: NADH-quinone oxidoreductase subunit NuoK [Luteibaculaceae bacterium]|nr:NADH-quinone oxidoreductase subunit NuoK [Luteibaculaceae bacterium]
MDLFASSNVPFDWYIYLSLALFAIGVCGVLMRRNAIVMFMSIELMLNSVNLLLVAYSAYTGKISGMVYVFFVMVVAAAEVAVGLALLVSIYRNIQSVDIDKLKSLKW